MPNSSPVLHDNSDGTESVSSDSSYLSDVISSDPSPFVHDNNDGMESVSSDSSYYPDLIIEKEPNRHDEPDEYYEELKIKMRKVYKRMFLLQGSSDESSSEISSKQSSLESHLVGESSDETSQNEVLEQIHQNVNTTSK